MKSMNGDDTFAVRNSPSRVCNSMRNAYGLEGWNVQSTIPTWIMRVTDSSLHPSQEPTHLGWVAVPRVGEDAIVNARRGLYPNVSKVGKRKVYAWARNVGPAVGTVQCVHLVFGRPAAQFDEDRWFSLGLWWDRSSGLQRRGTRRREGCVGRLT